MKAYRPNDLKNKKRVWPLTSASGAIVMVSCSGVPTMTTEDLTAWVESGLISDVTSQIPEREREPNGTFSPDDPSTPKVNEAWKGGKSPAGKYDTKPDVAIPVPVVESKPIEVDLDTGNGSGKEKLSKIPKSGKKKGGSK